MTGRIRGSFPGGPSREAPPEKRTRAPQLQRVEDIEAGLAKRSVSRKRRARRRRVVWGFLFSALVAGGVGVLLGVRSHATAEEQQAELRARSRPQEFDISSELNRTLMELWRMEDIEAARNRGRTR